MKSAPALVLLGLSLVCGRPGEESTLPGRAPEWRNVFSGPDGVQALTYRTPGQRSRLIYMPRTSSGKSELESVRDILSGKGYALITAEAPTGRQLTDKGAEDFLRFALHRPGAHTVVILTQGRWLGSVLKVLHSEETRVRPRAVIVLRPGDAQVGRVEQSLFENLARSAVETHLGWISSTEPMEASQADMMARRVRLSPELRAMESALNQNQKSTLSPELFRSEEQPLPVILAFARQEITWKRAEDVFQKGCSPDGFSRIYIGNYTVSSSAESDFCPLFMRTPEGRLLRAAGPADPKCTYRNPAFGGKMICTY